MMNEAGNIEFTQKGWNEVYLFTLVLGWALGVCFMMAMGVWLG